MRKLILIPLTLAVAACGQSARNETAEAADTLSADMNATRAEAAADVARADAMMGADANAQMDAANRIAEASGAPPSEARQLNDAADMLDEDSVSLNAVSQQPPDNSAKAR